MTEKDFQRIQELLTTSLNATEARNAERFDKIDKRLDGVERRLDKLEHEIKDVRGEIKDVRSSMEESFDAIGGSSQSRVGSEAACLEQAAGDVVGEVAEAEGGAA